MDNALKRVRTERGITQSTLARIARVNLRTLQAYERGARSLRKASAETLSNMASALNCKIHELLEES